MNDVLKPGAVLIQTTHNIKTTERIYLVVYFLQMEGYEAAILQYIPGGSTIPPIPLGYMQDALLRETEWRFAEPSVALKALIEHETTLVVQRQALNQEIDNVGAVIQELTAIFR